MPKSIFQDMVKINSTRRETPRVDIAPPRREENQKVTKQPPKIPTRSSYPAVEPEPSTPSRYGLWSVAIVSVMFLFFALTFLFAKASITIVPKSMTLNLAETLSAVKDGGPDSFSFDSVAISGEETQSVQAGEEQDLAEPAKGTVVIYNSFSTASQSLDINTRLEGSNGKMYKTDVKVVVPGKRSDGTPGSVEVGIHASEVGEGYNSGPLDFKIFGFKGTPKYEKFYARSRGSISGGIQGKYHTISPDEKARVEGQLHNALESKLLEKVSGEIPEGFILFKDAVYLRTEDSTSSGASKDSQVVLKQKGTLYGLILNEKELTDKITERILPNYDGTPVYISNIKDLKFDLITPDMTSFKDAESISFRLSGNPKVVWEVDTEKLSLEILGKKKKDFNQILTAYPNINSADLILRPIWKSAFPENEKDIKINVKAD